MSVKPILFSTEMVRGLLSDTKTATRRVVRPRYCDSVFEMFGGELCEASPYKPPIDNGDGTTTRFVRRCVPCKPPYRPGDILYARETWRVQSARRFDADARIMFKAGGDMVRIQFPGGGDQYHDRRQYDAFVSRWADDRWHPSIHMPREAARIFLRVADVRVERLQDITDDGAIQEGIQYTDFGTYLPNWKMSIDGGETFHNPQKEIHHPGYHVGNANTPDQCYPTAKGAYHALWDSTIKPADRALYGWDANPWVWVIEFERCERPKE